MNRGLLPGSFRISWSLSINLKLVLVNKSPQIAEVSCATGGSIGRFAPDRPSNQIRWGLVTTSLVFEPRHHHWPLVGERRAHPCRRAASLACHHPRSLSPASLTALHRHPPITFRATTALATRHLPNVQALRSTRRAPGLAAALHSRGFLTAAAYKLAQKQMPKMSETEKVALGCGTVGSDLC